VTRRIPIRRKLAAALAIPIAALLAVAGLEVLQSTRDANEVEEQTDLATASVGPSGVINSLQNERNYASLWLLGFEGAVQLPVESFEEAKQATDAAIDSFRADIESKGGQVVDTYGPALEALGGLTELRQQVDTFEGERTRDNTDTSDPNFLAYTEMVAGLFDANTQVALAIDDPVLRRGVELTDLASRQTDVIARTIRSLLLPGVTGNNQLDEPMEIAEASELFSQVVNNEAQSQSLGAGVYEPPARRLKEENDATGFIPLVQKTIDEAPGPVPLDAILDTVDVDQDTAWYGFRQRVEDILVDRADDLNAAAERMQMWFVVLAVVAVGVAVGVTWLVSRSITRPLRSLTGQATAMADHRLPEAVLDILDTPLGEDVEVPEVDPVAVHTRDEVSDVADALNTVQDSALDLAVEQAVLRRNIADSFVNLGRRNQNLLGRQLDFITELETNETNPDTLSNLFRLDHLATRMRRNAESLLVLAGVEPPRKWAAPVRLTDVIRAALGEVEDYQRVTVRGVEPATIVGAAAADLAHLLAELIENALVFSPPDQTVDIRGRSRPARAVGAEGMSRAAVGAEGMSRAAGGADQVSGYVLAIIDSGLGMPPADIEAANRRLAGAESFTIAPSKYLGHYVAGNLAARHGIGVRLDASPGNGITATVNIPPALLTTEPVVGVPAAPPDDGRELPAAGTPAAPEPVGVAAMAGGLVTSATEADAAEAGDPWGNGEYRPAVTSSWPAPVGLSAGTPPPEPGQSRTQSGLVKRARANGTGPVEPEPGPGTAEAGPVAPGAGPSGDLLAALRRHSANLQGVPGMAGQPPYPPPSARGPQSVPPSGAPPLSPTHRPGSGVYDPTARHDRLPGGEGRQRPPTRGEPPTRGPDVGAGQPPPRPPRGVPGPNGPTGPVPAGGTDASPRLTRRVRGAQMPTTSPMSLRRTTGEHPVAPGSPAAQPPDRAQPPRQTRSADDVYSFLTSFTAGVQRGLDDSRPPDRSGDDNGSG
jgi:signal transduction histidine kinase